MNDLTCLLREDFSGNSFSGFVLKRCDTSLFDLLKVSSFNQLFVL